MLSHFAWPEASKLPRARCRGQEARLWRRKVRAALGKAGWRGPCGLVKDLIDGQLQCPSCCLLVPGAGGLWPRHCSQLLGKCFGAVSP